MMVTEDEAKTKACPQALPPKLMQTCLGSACMAWRWHVWTEYTQTTDTDGCPTFSPEVRISETHGYCGKAGRPIGYAKPD